MAKSANVALLYLPKDGLTGAIRQKLPPSAKHSDNYNFPLHRPETRHCLVGSDGDSKKLRMVELTVPFEVGFQAAVA